MTRILLFVFSLMFSLSAVGQGSLNERLFQAKVRELVVRLHISEAQRHKFVPVYRRYSEEMLALWNSGGGRRGAASVTEQTKRRMLLQQQAQGIRMKYVDELATVLTPTQVERFFEVESIIQKKLMERKVRPQLNEKR